MMTRGSSTATPLPSDLFENNLNLNSVLALGSFGMEATPDLPGFILLVVDLNCA
jgi:hypothetical protein